MNMFSFLGTRLYAEDESLLCLISNEFAQVQKRVVFLSLPRLDFRDLEAELIHIITIIDNFHTY